MWDVRDEEVALLREKRRQRDELERALGMAKRITQLSNQPGFREFTEEIVKMRDRATRSLAETDGPSRELYRRQGEVRALENISRLMKHSEKAVESLAKQIGDHDNANTALEKNGKVTPSQSIWRL